MDRKKNSAHTTTCRPVHRSYIDIAQRQNLKKWIIIYIIALKNNDYANVVND